VGESKLGGYSLRCGVEGLRELTVRNEGRTIYTYVQNNCQYYRGNHRYHRLPHNRPLEGSTMREK